MIIVLFFFCSMSSETAVIFTGGHFNQAVFAVCYWILPSTSQNLHGSISSLERQ